MESTHKVARIQGLLGHTILLLSVSHVPLGKGQTLTESTPWAYSTLGSSSEAIRQSLITSGSGRVSQNSHFSGPNVLGQKTSQTDKMAAEKSWMAAFRRCQWDVVARVWMTEKYNQFVSQNEGSRSRP